MFRAVFRLHAPVTAAVKATEYKNISIDTPVIFDAFAMPENVCAPSIWKKVSSDLEQVMKT